MSAVSPPKRHLDSLVWDAGKFASVTLRSTLHESLVHYSNWKADHPRHAHS
jgi:hypothetical protein